MSSILAIIPARCGSKGLKDKNIKELNGKPMMAYTIEAAIQSGVFEDIIVSTDSPKYKVIAESYGASVPFLRPVELASDKSTTRDAILYVLDNLPKKYEYLMILQPTSPLRTKQNIIDSIKLLEEKNANAIVSVCEVDHPVAWNAKLDDTLCLDNAFSNLAQRQQQEVTYRLNGAIYLVKVDYYRRHKNIYKEKSFGYIMDRFSSVDVDNIYDFYYAETLLRAKNVENLF